MDRRSWIRRAKRQPPDDPSDDGIVWVFWIILGILVAARAVQEILERV